MAKYLYLWDKKDLNSEEEEIKKYLTRNQYQHFIQDENGIKAQKEFDETIDTGEWKKIEEKINDPFMCGIRSFLDYKDLCEQFYLKQPIYYDKSNIWWLWNFKEKKWEMIDETDIMNNIDYALRFTAVNTIKNKAKQEIIEALRRIGRKNKPKIPNKNWIQFKNYVYDIDTNNKFVPSAEYFFVNPIPHNIGNSEDTPVIDKLFTDWAGENKITLYEILSYCLYSDYPIHRIFCFTGTGRNGKSKYLELIRRFIGIENSTSTELDTLIDNRFESAKLYKKLVCMLGETNYNNLKNTSSLKRLTGQDLIGYEFKNKNPFDDYNYSKVLIATNGIPITHDKSEGFYRRWIIIDFPNKFPEGKDILATIPDYEFENLALKSVKTLKNLLDRCSFTNEANIEEKAKKYEEKSNPLILFNQKFVTKDFEGYIYKFEYEDRFLVWAKENGFRKLSQRDINAYMCELGIEQGKRGPTENRVWSWLGLSWIENKANVQDVQDVQQCYTDFSYKETDMKVLDKLDKLDRFKENLTISWDNQAEVWHKCKLCQESPTNEYRNGLFYCKKHFEQLTAHYKDKEIISEVI